jgi:hypothetical protein
MNTEEQTGLLEQTGFVIYEPPSKAFNHQVGHPVLHRAECPAIRDKDVLMVDRDKPLARIIGWERPCRRCCRDVVDYLGGGS